MKKIVRLALSMLFVTILSVCTSATPQSADETIRPGDEIATSLSRQEKKVMLRIHGTWVASNMGKEKIVPVR